MQPNLASTADALERIRKLLPQIRSRAAQADADRRVPNETIRDLQDAGLFNIVTPKIFGGSQLGLGAMVQATAEIAAACGSTGWVYGVLTGHNWMLGLFSPEAQKEVFADARALTASVFRFSGQATPVDGGYRLTNGEGRFCSGIDHSQWALVGGSVKKADGVEPRFFLIPSKDIEIVDDWFTMGMRGTGSRSIRVKDAFIPEHRTLLTAELMRGGTPGSRYHSAAPIYSAPFPVAQPFSLIGAPIGMAMGALQLFADGLSKKFAGMNPDHASEQGATFERVAQAYADVDAAMALTLQDCAWLDHSDAPAALPPIERARIQRDFAYVAHKCRTAVTAVFEAGGGSGIYDASALQRVWRDVHAASVHAAFGWDDAATTFGRLALGLPPSKFGRK